MDDFEDSRLTFFLNNPEFRNWVLHPTRESDRWWRDWMAAHPDQTPVLEKARDLILAINVRFDNSAVPPDEMVEADIAGIIRALREKKTNPVHGEKRYPIRVFRWAAAAALVACCFTLGWQLYKRAAPGGKVNPASQTAGSTMIVLKNTNNGPRMVLMDDGSMVTLEPGSALRYPAIFGDSSRNVYLDGEAFFDVAKNPARPFLVYAGQTVTKVLGTSFRIRASRANGTVLVAVRTGKVSVYSQASGEAGAETPVELSPDEQVVFAAGHAKMQKEVVRDPRKLISSADLREVSFEDRPVAEILNRLASLYGVEITLGNEKLARYTLTTQFKEEGLRQRLDVICDAIDATYTIENGRIVINSLKPRM